MKERKTTRKEKMKENKYGYTKRIENSIDLSTLLYPSPHTEDQVGIARYNTWRKSYRDAVSRGQESRAEIEKLPTTREQANREFVNGLNLHHDPHQNFSRRWIDDLQRR